ncbi:Sir2 family NAD-dependent protein deacetylase, partial [Kingella negevensis]|uniref:protein acetyllysine N-acetyltransferase n=1 Tax=Kingella negevensis TaxID=1522312 RepID=A0A238HJA3_9NEIS|nr:Sir2 family NAD-dependent protein deacetylase [Kingella negevensis]MDK4685648.1 Sir2 family NAD-dependent protein deacetylase [Kingella negevensis]
MKKPICLVLSGAGISVESGLSTFRGNGGLWAGYRIEDVCTPEGFKRDPQQVLDFYNTRRQQAELAQPNAAHKLLAELGAIDNSKKEAKDLRYCFHTTILNLCHVPKHAYK